MYPSTMGENFGVTVVLLAIFSYLQTLNMMLFWIFAEDGAAQVPKISVALM